MNDTAARVLAQAARAVGQVAYSGSSADELSGPDAGTAAVRAVSLGTLRWYWRLKALVEVLLAETRVTPPVRSLLLVSLHQLEHSRNPPETIVSSAVDAVRVLRQPRAAGMVNALLRRFLREREAILARALADPAVAVAHPRWLYGVIREHWREQSEAIFESNNSHPPMTLRVNLARVSREHYHQRLREHGIEARAIEWLPSGLILERPLPVAELPGFDHGEASVQDAGAQLASALLDARSGERVLDACAAPGGKTGSILERTTALQLTAIDIDPARTTRISDNLRRINVQAQVISADLSASPSWWDGLAFDRILLDAPCSATGVIGRHPDIKLLRRAQDIAGFVQIQRRLLQHSLGLLRSGGTLLYSTCSLIPDENERVVEAVLAAVPRARVMPFPSAVGLPPHSLLRSAGMQLLPGNAARTDGFYYACLTVT